MGHQLNIPSIEHALFECVTADGKACGDVWPKYMGDSPRPADPAVFADQLVSSLSQPVEKTDGSAMTVFRAAVLAIASNMRVWSKIQAPVTKYLDELGDTIPAPEDIQASNWPLATVLGGISAKRDIAGIADWAALLQEQPGYYTDAIELVRDDFTRASTSMPDSWIFLAVAAYFGADPSWNSAACKAVPHPPKTMKWPQMGLPLGAEFLRNLGWSGFKPDRHIIRLLEGWIPEATPQVVEQCQSLTRLVGRSDKQLVQQLTTGLAGNALTPEGVEYSRADNLLWLLGSEIETSKRGATRLPSKYLIP